MPRPSALEQGLDTGPTYGVMTETIRPTDTAGDLLQRLSTAGAGLLVATLDGLEAGDLEAVPQPGEGVSLAPKITVEDARVRWERPALAVDRQIRGCTPAPGAWTTFRGERLKLLPVTPAVDGPLGGTRRDRARPAHGPRRHRHRPGGARHRPAARAQADGRGRLGPRRPHRCRREARR